MAGRMATVLLAVVAAVALLQLEQAQALGRGLTSSICLKNGKRCSLYSNDCCNACTMPKECSSQGLRSECQPECRRQELEGLVRVEFPSSSGMTPAFEGRPDKKSAVIVMQEWWGVNDAIKETAQHIADQGYRVLIPDLYRGRVALQQMEAVGLQSQLNWTQGVDDIVHAAQYLRNTGARRVAIMGFCQGGAAAFCGAQYARVDAAVVFYGIPNTTVTGCDPLKSWKTVPIQAHFGTEDRSFPPTRIQPLAASMVANGIDMKLFMYPGLPHAFFNAVTPAGRALFVGNTSRPLPDEQQVTAAFSRVTNFLRKHIRNY